MRTEKTTEDTPENTPGGWQVESGFCRQERWWNTQEWAVGVQLALPGMGTNPHPVYATPGAARGRIRMRNSTRLKNSPESSSGRSRLPFEYVTPQGGTR